MPNKSDRKPVGSGPASDNTEHTVENDQRRGTARRRLMKNMAGGSSAIVVSAAFSDGWVKPVVNAVTLPAHAQTTQVPIELSAEIAEFLSDDTSDTDSPQGPFSCGTTANVPIGDADWDDISFTGITATVAPAGTPVSLEVTGNAVSVGEANQTSQTVDSDPTNGEATFADITFDSTADTGDTGEDENLSFTFSADGEECIIDLTTVGQ